MGLENGIKKTMMAGIGAMATTAEAAKNVVDTLAKRGAARPEDAHTTQRRRQKKLLWKNRIFKYSEFPADRQPPEVPVVEIYLI